MLKKLHRQICVQNSLILVIFQVNIVINHQLYLFLLFLNNYKNELIIAILQSLYLYKVLDLRNGRFVLFQFFIHWFSLQLIM